MKYHSTKLLCPILYQIIKFQNIILDLTCIFIPLSRFLYHILCQRILHSWMGDVQSIVLYGLRLHLRFIFATQMQKWMARSTEPR